MWRKFCEKYFLPFPFSFNTKSYKGNRSKINIREAQNYKKTLKFFFLLKEIKRIA